MFKKLKIMQNKKGFLPQVLGLEIHYLFIGIAVGIVATIVLLLLSKGANFPVKLCSWFCKCP